LEYVTFELDDCLEGLKLFLIVIIRVETTITAAIMPQHVIILLLRLTLYLNFMILPDKPPFINFYKYLPHVIIILGNLNHYKYFSCRGGKNYFYF